jgi:hypothetical protein
MALWSTHPLTNVEYQNLRGSKKSPAFKTKNLIAISEPNVGASTSHKAMDLHGLLEGYLSLLSNIQKYESKENQTKRNFVIRDFV